MMKRFKQLSLTIMAVLASASLVKASANDTILFRAGLEEGEAPMFSDSVFAIHNVTKFSWASKPECSPRQEEGYVGKGAIMFSGKSVGTDGAYCTYMAYSVDILVDSATNLGYWIYPNQENARYVAVDFICDDGSTLRDCGATDQNGMSMHPNAGHGGEIPLNTWSQVTSNVGKWLKGKVIKSILINFDSKLDGDYRGFIDEIVIANGSLPSYDTALFKTGLEPEELQPSFNDSVINKNNATHFTWASKPECSVRQETAHAGVKALMYSGQSTGNGAYLTFWAFDVNIPVETTTKLSYWILPEQDNGRYVAIDFVCADGQTLRDVGAVDQNGIDMHPKFGHGGNIPLNEWSQIKCNIGQWLNGKTITKILVNFDKVEGTGDLKGFIDDIEISTSIKHDVKVGNIVLQPSDSISLNVGDSAVVSVSIQPLNATVKDVKFSISKPSVASIDEITGKIIAKKAGKAIVSVIPKDGSDVKVQLTLNVKDTVSTTSIKQTSSKINVYPNPVVNKLYVSGAKDIVHIDVVSLDGKLIKSVQTVENQLSIDMSSVQNGMYFLRLYDKNNNASVSKIVKK